MKLHEYHCDECGDTFGLPKLVTEKVAECPHCGSFRTYSPTVREIEGRCLSCGTDEVFLGSNNCCGECNTDARADELRKKGG